LLAVIFCLSDIAFNFDRKLLPQLINDVDSRLSLPESGVFLFNGEFAILDCSGLSSNNTLERRNLVRLFTRKLFIVTFRLDLLQLDHVGLLMINQVPALVSHCPQIQSPRF
jgi:hypothetical protein